MTKTFEELSPEGKINRLHEELAELRAILTRIAVAAGADGAARRRVVDSFGSEFSVGQRG